MIRLPVPRPAVAALVLALSAPAPLIAQASPGTFSLPPGTPAPSPTPAGPADERAGVAIPPRAVPRPTPSAAVIPAPSSPAAERPVPSATLPPPVRSAPAPAPSAAREGTAPAAAPGPAATLTPQPLPSAGADPQALPDGVAQPPTTGTVPEGPVTIPIAPEQPAALPAWWPSAAGGFAALAVLLVGWAWLWRRRKPRVLRLAPPASDVANTTEAGGDARLDLALEITSATRSLMRFTLGYRLTVANRSGRAVLDARVALQLACARASVGQGPSAGAAQGLAAIARIGPQQSQSITGEVHLPLAAIQPLLQGKTPLFVPLVHVTLEAEGQRALTRTFVIGPRSASGRVHPIALDQPPGSIAGLVAQIIALPPAAAAA